MSISPTVKNALGTVYTLVKFVIQYLYLKVKRIDIFCKWMAINHVQKVLIQVIYTVSGNRAFIATVGIKARCMPNVAIQIVAGQVVCTGSDNYSSQDFNPR